MNIYLKMVFFVFVAGFLIIPLAQCASIPLDSSKCQQSTTQSMSGAFSAGLGVSGGCSMGGNPDYAMTQVEYKPLWFIDLKRSYTIDTINVQIINNSPAGFSNAYFLVSDTSPSFSQRTINYLQICHYKEGNVAPGQDLEIQCEQPISGRYLSIMLNQKMNLAFCNLRVYEYNGTANSISKKNLKEIELDPNLALITSVLSNRNADEGVNGDCRFHNFDWNIAMSTEEEMPFWSIDLGKSYSVGVVQLGMAMESSGYFRNVYVMVGDSKLDINHRHKDFRGVCAYIKGPEKYGELMFIECNRQGRFVSVIINHKSHLVLCNVKIFENTIPVNQNEVNSDFKEKLLLNPALARQSSTFTDPSLNSFPASKSITGDCRVSNHGYSSTEKQSQPFLIIDLQNNENIGLIKTDVPLSNEAFLFSDAYFIVSEQEGHNDTTGGLEAACAHYKGPAKHGDTVIVRCNKYGRYLTILLNRESRLQLCGLMVYKGEPQWSVWSSWLSCSNDCGAGLQTRSRSCLHVGSSLTGCSGSSSQFQTCNAYHSHCSGTKELLTIRCWSCDQCSTNWELNDDMKLMNSCKMCLKIITKSGGIQRQCLHSKENLKSLPGDDSVVYHCETDACNYGCRPYVDLMVISLHCFLYILLKVDEILSS